MVVAMSLKDFPNFRWIKKSYRKSDGNNFVLVFYYSTPPRNIFNCEGELRVVGGVYPYLCFLHVVQKLDYTPAKCNVVISVLQQILRDTLQSGFIALNIPTLTL